MKLFPAFAFFALLASVSARDCRCLNPVFSSIAELTCGNLIDIFDDSHTDSRHGGPRSLLQALGVIEYSAFNYFSYDDACYLVNINNAELFKNNTTYFVNLKMAGILTETAIDFELCQCQELIPSGSGGDFCSTILPNAIDNLTISIKQAIVTNFNCTE